MSKISIIAEFVEFLKYKKKLWLLPLVLMLMLCGILLILTQGSVLVPFIYTFF